MTYLTYLKYKVYYITIETNWRLVSIEYTEYDVGACETVSENECGRIAQSRNMAYDGNLNSHLNPPGCFIAYVNTPDTMWFNSFNSATGQYYDCTSAKTCVCRKGM